MMPWTDVYKRQAPRSQLIQKQREKELQLANSSVANLEKLHAAAERELESYKKAVSYTHLDVYKRQLLL